MNYLLNRTAYFIGGAENIAPAYLVAVATDWSVLVMSKQEHSFFAPLPTTLLVALGVIVVLFMCNRMDAALRRNGRSQVLISAARYGDTHMVKTLLDQGADTTFKDHYGKTALEYAKEDGHSDIVALLKDARANNIRR